MALNAYISATQLLLHDTAGQRYSISDLTTYINSARSQLALEGECVRFLYGLDGIVCTGVFNTASSSITGITGLGTLDTITGWNVWSAGCPSGTIVYSSTGGTSIVMYGQTGSAQNASVSGTLSMVVSPPNATATNKEVYALPTSVSATLGIQSIIQVKSVSINYGGYSGSNQYMLQQTDFTYLQAYYRFYGPNLTGNPAVFARYQGNIFLRPIPSQIYPMQWDTICSVVNLVDDTTPEAIPYPFTDCVSYFAAYLALMNSQRAADADAMFKLYDQFARRARAFIQRTYSPSIYAQ